MAYDYEGIDFAKWLNSKGITAFVLKYKLPDSKLIIKKHLALLQDAQPIDSISAKPNFMVLVYPVISLKDSITHRGPKLNLLGKYP